VAVASACALSPPGAELYPELAEYTGREVVEVRITGGAPFSEDELEELIRTEATKCRLLGLPFCIPFTHIGRQERRLDLGVAGQDVVRLATFFRRSGFFGTVVDPEVAPVNGGVAVEFRIDRGDEVILDSLSVDGVAGILDTTELRRDLPLRAGERFSLFEFESSADVVLRRLLALGHAHAEVLRSYTVDTIRDRATARILAVPGPTVVVDSIIVVGAEHLGRETVLRALTFRPGSLLRGTELAASQRNLYGLEIVDFATVEIAADSLQVTPGDSTRSTVLVRVTEGPVHVVEAGIGFGTVDCFRTDAQWVSRSFMGGARRLALTGALEKIGLGGPGVRGSARGICRAFEGDTFADALDYRLLAELSQPYFLGTRNRLNLAAFWERESEPNIFQRRTVGARLGITRTTRARDVLSVGLESARNQVLVDEVRYCLAFEVCAPADIAQLAQPHWRSSVGGSWTRDRTDALLDPTTGMRARVGAEWATPLLASEVEFLRSSAEGSVYRTVRPLWVAAANLRVGTFLGAAELRGTDAFIPPEERFYAGGANSVRGFARNELGPGLYVGDHPVLDSADIRFVPVGGLSVVTGTVELRLPSPIWRDALRAAVFVDAGAVSENRLGGMSMGDFRVTPGVGLRLGTPVGPARLDIAYNPYGPPEGPLYLPAGDTGDFVRVLPSFAPERPRGFLDRLRLHLAVGQAF